MIEINRSWIGKLDRPWKPSHTEPEGLYSPENIDRSLRAYAL